MKLLINEIERILHLPGNYKNGNVLEMTYVLDYGMEWENLENTISDVTKRLKSHSEIFRNVRLNVVDWVSDSDINNCIIPMSMVTIRKNNNPCKYSSNVKHLEVLTEYLKKFHARSKIIILFTDGNYVIGDKQRFKDSLIPFLGRKMIVCGSGCSHLTIFTPAKS